MICSKVAVFLGTYAVLSNMSLAAPDTRLRARAKLLVAPDFAANKRTEGRKKKKASPGPITGKPESSKTAIRRRARAAKRGCKEFFVGYTSGKNGPKERCTKKYKKRGFTELVVVYESSKAKEAKKVEKDLTTYFGAEANNETGGGGGPNGKDSPHYVYIACKKGKGSKRKSKRKKTRKKKKQSVNKFVTKC